MPPIKAIIHEATFSLRAATDGTPTVVVIVGAGVAKQRQKNRNLGHEQSCLLWYATVEYLSMRSLHTQP